MKLYKDTNNNLFGYELDGSQDHLIPSDQVALTQAELDAREVMLAQQKAQEEAEAQAKVDSKQSALSKLMALGLTEEEALALGVK